MMETQNNNSTTPMQTMTPLDATNRLQHIDSLRGFALLGILIVNMLAFQYGTFGNEFIYPSLTATDQLASKVIDWFFRGSFYPIFSMLFGFGAVLMWERAKEKTTPFYPFYIRRMVILLLIGFIHLYFIWDGDILLNYAITGTLFLFLIKRTPRVLFQWVIILAVIINLPSLAPQGEDSALLYGSYMETEQEVLSEGAYGDVVAHRFSANPYQDVDYGINLDSEEHQAMVTFTTVFSFVMTLAQTFMLFLLGGFIAKMRWLHHPKEHFRFLIKVAVLALVIGLSLKAGMVFPLNASLNQLGYFLGGPILSLGYMSLFSLIFVKVKSAKVLRGFAYVGRMALTNYLTHSIIMTTIFYGYGFGLFGKLGVVYGTLLAILLFNVQVFFSSWWLKRFHFGPMELLWRFGIYLKPQKMKK